MDKPVRVLLADDNRDFVKVLEAFIQSQADMEIVGVAYDGREALNLIYQGSPDVVVLDMVMPLLDGLGVLEKLQYEEERPSVIILSAFDQETIIRRASSLGANYCIIKPFDLDNLGKRIRQLRKNKNSTVLPGSGTKTQSVNDTQEMSAKNLEVEVTSMMLQLGIPAHVKGYQYLRDAIVWVVQEVSLLDAVTGKLYPMIAAKYKTTPNRVERGIRHAIELAWERGNIEFKNKFIGNNSDGTRPTNSNFIALLADKLRMSNLG